MPYEYADGEYVDIGDDDTGLSPRAEQALGGHVPAVVNEDDEPDRLDWYASDADERVADRFDDDDTYQPRVRRR